MGNPGCPIPLRAGCVLTFPRAGAWGNRGSLAMNMIARASRPHRVSAGMVTAPFPNPPPLGAGTRLLPPAGGGWEGG